MKERQKYRGRKKKGTRYWEARMDIRTRYWDLGLGIKTRDYMHVLTH